MKRAECKGKRVLVMGVSGQDRDHIPKSLLDNGCQVVETSNNVQVSSSMIPEALGIRSQAELLSIAPNDCQNVFQCISNTNPDEIFNITGQTSVGLSFENPVEKFESITISYLNIFESIRMLKRPFRFYNDASNDCFGNTKSVVGENTAFREQNHYATSKANAFLTEVNYRESYVKFVCKEVLSNYESPLHPARFVASTLVATTCRIKDGSCEKLRMGRTDISRNGGGAPEFIEAIQLMLCQEWPVDFVVVTGKPHPPSDFMSAVFECLEQDWRDHVVSDLACLRLSDITVNRLNQR